MRLSIIPTAILLSTLIAACAGAASTPTSQPSPDAGSAWLRATTTQAIPPASLFAVQPVAVVTGDGQYVVNGPVDAIYPGPLLPNLLSSPISEAGREAIAAEARRLGLLGPKTDFRSPIALPGGVTGRIELTIDGQPVMLLGDPAAEIVCIMAPCDPLPGTPEAFGTFWRELADPTTWLADALGPASPFVPDAYAILVGPPPTPDASLGAQVIDWPLETPLATFGGPVANGTLRCGTVAGTDADTLRPALESANQLTQWTQDPSASAAFGLTVRPVIAGEDPCAETFGIR